jgi:hypothetical protein
MKKKKYLKVGLSLLFTGLLVCSSFTVPETATAGVTEDLRSEVESLKRMLLEMEKKLSKLDERSSSQLTDVEDSLDELDERVGDNERHTATDKLAFNVDLRTKFASLHYNDLKVMPEFAQVMMNLWAFDELITPITSIPDDLGTFTRPTAVNPESLAKQLSDSTFNLQFMQKYDPNLQSMMMSMLTPGPTGATFLAGFHIPSQPNWDPMGTGTAITDVNGFMDAATALMMLPGMMAAGMSFPADAIPLVSHNTSGMPLFGREFTPQDMAMYQGMFKSIDPSEVDLDNDFVATTRVRFDVRSDPNPHLTFGGRLSANKTWSDSTGVGWYTSSGENVAMDGNIHTKNSDSVVRVERAFVTYRDIIGDVHWHFSLGRRPALGGTPSHFKSNSGIAASPLSHVINWQFDGASLGFDLSEVTDIPGLNYKLCWGQGFENGVGNSYAMDHEADVDDVQFAGHILRLYQDDKTTINHLYAHAFDVTDGFSGLVAMPFAITGVDFNHDDIYDAYALDANRGGYISRFEATANIGSMDLANISLTSEIFGINYFVDLAGSYCRPDGVSQSPLMQFMGTDSLLNSNGEDKNRTGYSIWVGLSSPAPWEKGTFGFEYNYGSKYWISFTGSEDTIGGSKLGTRGQVFDFYYHHEIMPQLFVTANAMYYDYEYTGSGNPLGKPVKIDDVTAFDSLIPVVDDLWVGSASLNYRW